MRVRMQNTFASINRNSFALSIDLGQFPGHIDALPKAKQTITIFVNITVHIVCTVPSETQTFETNDYVSIIDFVKCL